MVLVIDDLIIGAIIAGAVTLLVRRPLAEATEGLFLSEEAPVRTALTMYVSGVVTRDYFENTMRQHDIAPADHQAYLAYADFKIANANAAKEAIVQKEVTSALKDVNKDYDKIVDDADDIELDTFVQDVKNKIADLDPQRDVVKALFTLAAKKGGGAAELAELVAYNDEIAALNNTVFVKRAEILARRKLRCDARYEGICKIQPNLPPAPVFGEKSVNPFAVVVS
jgi:hypothetical protein